MATKIEQWVTAVKALSANELSKLADCMSPDTGNSSGALMLYYVRDASVESVEYGDLHLDGYERGNERPFREIAAGAPDVYSYPKWQEFVDLGAWQEEIARDVSDDFVEFALGGLAEGMDRDGTQALFMIADRLVRALVAMGDDIDDDDDDDDETDPYEGQHASEAAILAAYDAGVASQEGNQS
jgi:hypothetical protein